ncbi:MAG: argininosuccinate lyase [Roseovarius sp.]
MRRLIACICLAVLAGCGVDGEPIPPGAEPDDTVARNDPTVVRPNINGALTVGTNGSRASVGTSIISGNVSVHVGKTF